ncbi:GntR family transcriptional regulator [uncultured Fusobacterium sp.]|uniref:GntR family transcriptional regulator n=1 Tax=uncultured Fusobacterium sp. TaxID=159267 RepID=UPI000BBB3BD6|nr:GntR family transcriptional regulator [uncultured Fusobacterium sp.]BBA50235.1 putative transcriptional regulator [Fusobacterium varium]
MEDKKVSKYQLVESYIVEGIQSNHYKVNDILPTEAELSEKFNCSRVTVRQALSNLAYKGIIYRIQGKGSFVSKENTLKRSPLLKSFTEDILDMGKKPWSIVETFHITKVGEHIGRIMGLKPNEKIYYIERIRFADNDPILFEKTYMEISKHPEMSVKILEGSKYEYAKKQGMEISISYQNITPVFPPENIAEKLKISSKTPILKLSNVTYLSNGELFDYNELYMNTELYQLNIVKKVEK